MEFVEHDLKDLIEYMKLPFMQSEVKTLMHQLLSAVALLHSNYIIHRDLKTSNLLLSNTGQIKVADFGLARKFSDPVDRMTPLVVTLWYRAPEILLGAKKYGPAIDIWSVGCIFGELLDNTPLIAGRSEIDQLSKMFQLLGTPNNKIWPGFSKLPNAKMLARIDQPYSFLSKRYPNLPEDALDLLSKLLIYDPRKRITAQQALDHVYFTSKPYMKHPDLFPTWPTKQNRPKTSPATEAELLERVLQERQALL